MKNSTFSAQVANSIKHLLQGYSKTIRLLLVMFLTLTVTTNAWGAEYTITFKSASSDSSSDLGATPNVSDVVSSGTSYVASFSGCSKMYVGTSGIKLGSSKATGTMNFTLATNYQSNIKSIKVVSAKYGSDTGTLTLFSGSTSLKSGISPGTDYTHTFSSPTKVTSLKLATSAKRAYITKIVITTEEAATCTTSPTVSAGSNSNVTTTTATVSCSDGITSLGSAGCSIESYGFVYGTSSNPTISNTKVQVGTTYTTTGTAFSKGLTGLTANTTYYVRPYATNGNGTAYGTQTSFKTLELPKYTVTLNAGPGTCAASVTEKSAGAGVELPEPTLDCGDWEFAGWKTTSAVTIETTTKPTLIAAGAYSPTSDITLYAVYQRTEGGGGSSTTTTFTFADIASAKNWSNGTAYTPVEISPITITAKGGGNNAKYYTSDKTWRMYNEGSLEITTSTGSITNVSSNPSCTFTITNGMATCSFSETTKFKSITVTSGSGSTTYYHSTPDCATQMAPSLSVSGVSESSLAFGNVTVNQSSQKTFTLSGYNLTADATLALSGTNEGLFSVTPLSVTPTDGSITNDITVTYTPTAKASHSAILTISSPGAESIEIQLSGTGVAQMADYTVNHYQQNITDDNYTLKETETPLGEVGTSVTPDVKSYTGFTAPSTETVTIKADGTTVVEYYYTRNSYTLTWDVNEGNDLTGEYTSGSVKFGATITKPADPTRENHNFKGWKDQNGSTVVASTMPADDLTYTAQWKATYTVTWLVEGQPYTIGNPTTTVEDGQNITAIPSDPPLLTCAVKFMGWSIESSGSTPEDPLYYSDLFTTLDEAKVISINEDMTFHAVFATKEDGIQSESVTVTKESFSAVDGTLDENISYDSQKGNGTANPAISDNAIRLYQNTSGKTGGYIILSAKNDCKITSASITSTSNSTTGYIFSNSTYAPDKDDFIVNDYEISANGTYTVSELNTSYITFACFGKTSSTRLNISKISVTYIKEGDPAYSAYITSCCETPVPTNGNAEVLSGTSVKLTWEGSASRYHITGGNLTAAGVYTNAISDTISGLTECETYTFNISAAPQDACESAAISVTATPFEAKTITFEDGSTTTTLSTTCENDEIVVPTPTARNCSTYVWIDEQGNEYDAGDKITPTTNMTLTTVWTVIRYTVTFVDYDGTTVLKESEVNCGEMPTPPADPTRPESNTHKYTFAGWTPSIKEADGKQTYTATYTETQHQITVIWMVNGEEYTEGEPSNMVLAGEKVAKLPTPPSPDDYCGQVFAGWTDQPINSAPIENAPAVLFNTPEASPTLYKEGDKTTVTFYAVFADIKE